MKFRIIIFLFTICFGYQSFSQDRGSMSNQEHYYFDYVADENGARLSGIRVKVKGKNSIDYTNANGEFTVKAQIGDEIELSKSGVIINTYIYDGSSHYEVEDNSSFGFTDFKSKESKRSNVLLDSAMYYSKSDPFKSISFVEAELKSSHKKRRKSSDNASAYEILGDVYMNLKQYDLAISNYNTSLETKSSNSVKIKLAKAYSLNGNAVESNLLLKPLSKKNLSDNEEIEVLETIGFNQLNTNNYEDAITNYRNSLSIANLTDNNQKSSELNSKIAEIYSLQGKKTVAENYLDDALNDSKDENLNQRAQVNNSVANQYRDQQDFDTEIRLKKQTLEEMEDANINEISENDNKEKISVQQLNLDIGNAYANKQFYEKAIDYLEKSKTNADGVLDIETKKEAVEQLSEIYKTVGDNENALKNYQEYVNLVDILYKKKEKEISDAVELNKNLISQQNRINSLEKDRELSESKYLLTESEQRVSVENYKRQKTIIYSLIGGLVLMLIAFYFMYKNNKQRRLANNLLALKSLRSQMNPHFIFNALNSVNGFIAQNDERTANRYLTDFSTLMRNVLNNSEEDFIPLSKEVELLKLYLKLEHSRFKDKFDYEIEIDNGLNISEYQIPPMLLQPYIENAVWHGLRYKSEKGFLKVSFFNKNLESIIIEISDDGIGRKKSKELKTENQKKQQSKGMDNIKKRIAILNEMYSDKVDVFIEDLTSNSGTKVTLTLKKD